MSDYANIIGALSKVRAKTAPNAMVDRIGSRWWQVEPLLTQAAQLLDRVVAQRNQLQAVQQAADSIAADSVVQQAEMSFEDEFVSFSQYDRDLQIYDQTLVENRKTVVETCKMSADALKNGGVPWNQAKVAYAEALMGKQLPELQRTYLERQAEFARCLSIARKDRLVKLLNAQKAGGSFDP